MATITIEASNRNYLSGVGGESYEEDWPSDEEKENEEECDFVSSFVQPSSSSPDLFESISNVTIIDDDWLDFLLPQTTSETLFPGVKDRKPTNLYYQRAYNISASENSTGGEHLSNEEWAALRLQRDQRLRQILLQTQRIDEEAEAIRYSREVEWFFVNRQPSEWDQAEQRHQQEQLDMLEDQEVLLFEAFEEEAGYNQRDQQHQQQHREGARQVPLTTQAQREHLNHRSASLFAQASRLLLHPWRSVSRRYASNPNMNEQLDSNNDQDAGSLEGMILDPFILSGTGWTPGQNNGQGLEGDDDTTSYWSTGTAIETDCESFSSCGVLAAVTDAEKDFVGTSDGLPGERSPSRKSTSNQREMEEGLFPDDPFETCYYFVH